MGGFQSFLDSFKKGFEEESEKSAERMAHSTYRTVTQREQDHVNSFRGQSDGALLQQYNRITTSEEDKEIIEKILKGRGYKKHKNGTYGRPSLPLEK